ncbi:putative ribosomal protein MRP10 [Helianthus debilis subsp. tardiflorus]
MGKKAGELHINAKKFGGLAKPCMKDMLGYLGCLSLNHNVDEKCTRQRQLLASCMETQV